METNKKAGGCSMLHLQAGIAIGFKVSALSVPEVQARMFELFYTTKPPGEGSGQGLDIARRIVQEHGGRLEVVSAPGGTDFIGYLPVS